MCCTVHTNHPCSSLPFIQPCLMGLLQRIWPVELVPLYSYFSFPWCFQMGKHDEAWMILKQVHDTNMRAKGEPERVFTVSFTKSLTYKRKNGHNSPGEAQHLLIPSWESPFHCDHPQHSEIHLMHFKLNASLLFQSLVNPVNCCEYSSSLVFHYSIQTSDFPIIYTLNRSALRD